MSEALNESLNKTLNQVQAERQSIPERKSFLREIALPSNDSNARRLKNPASFWQKVFSQDSTSKIDGKNISNQHIAQCFRIELGGWVNLPNDVQGVVLLGFEYADSSGKHRHILDAMPARGAAQILLSGTVEFVVTGSHQDLQLYCYGVEDRSVWVDNLRIDIQRILANGIHAV